MKIHILPDTHSAECVFTASQLNGVPHNGLTDVADQFRADLSDESTDIIIGHLVQGVWMITVSRGRDVANFPTHTKHLEIMS